MCVACWTLYMVHPADYLPGVTTDLLSSRINTIIEEHLGSISTTLFFLMGAMTIVEVVDQYGGFNFVRDTLKTQSKRGLLWRVVALTFILSAILDNMTTTIVMIMVLRKLVRDHSDRIIYASLIILAANAGGAFSPIGDVTTIMLWNVGSITAAGVIEELLIPSWNPTHRRKRLLPACSRDGSTRRSSCSAWVVSSSCPSSATSPTCPRLWAFCLSLPFFGR